MSDNLNNTNTSFEEWMAKVGEKFTKLYGFSIEDVADQNYMDMYNNGYTVAECVDEVIENEGLEVDSDDDDDYEDEDDE